MKKRTLSKPVYAAIYFGVVAACILIDQLSKYLIGRAVAAHGNIRVLGSWLMLVWRTNSGAVGGIFSDLSWSNVLFFVLTVLAVPAFGLFLLRARTRSVWGQIGFAFIIGGTIGNAIDRLYFAESGKFFSGHVRDFVYVDGFFGIFNLADSFLVVGVILAFIALFFTDPDSLIIGAIADRKRKQAAAQPDAPQPPEANEAAEQNEQNEHEPTAPTEAAPISRGDNEDADDPQ